ncbi:MAG: beta-N-acetylhexosaminidase [Sutterellaceae bacterium]|nr:beta-N-acetylhexosaminidase [Burkholderiaceae bacterium]MCX7901536.1 beta-N-acetylhexosaminidase [Burkholderiaceae bacterium]MDW8429806.1 beta-N-acetylhexosaminidase [Sutterellaceae bacterium]
MLGPVVTDVAGPTLTPVERERLRHPLVGMVILFSRNFVDNEQLVALITEIRSLREPPLLIAVDHEGGRVQRFRRGFTAIPPMAELGRLWDRDVLAACRTAVSVGYVIGAELRAHGVDLTFAPVLDLAWGRSAVIGDRALHADARVVTMLASHLCHGLARAGMANCGKHFPGHGWARADSHQVVPRDTRSLARILKQDAAPYAWLGAALCAVMPAHVVYERVDRLPAGFSRRWIEDILRGRLGFTGVVFSDDLSMAGARVVGGVLESAEAALEAGCDFVLVCNDAAATDRVLDGLRWKAAEDFLQRLMHIMPRGGALTPRSLHDDARYRRACADIAAWCAASTP